HDPEHEQGVREDRPDHRALRDDRLSLAQREDDEEQLRQVAERRLHEARDPGAEQLADALDADGHDMGEAGERDGREGERDDRVPVPVAREPGEEREDGDARQDDAVGASERAQCFSMTRSISPYSWASSGRKKWSRSMSRWTSSTGRPVW